MSEHPVELLGHRIHVPGGADVREASADGIQCGAPLIVPFIQGGDRIRDDGDDGGAEGNLAERENADEREDLGRHAGGRPGAVEEGIEERLSGLDDQKVRPGQREVGKQGNDVRTRGYNS
jgi:hypothetical protein